MKQVTSISKLSRKCYKLKQMAQQSELMIQEIVSLEAKKENLKEKLLSIGRNPNIDEKDYKVYKHQTESEIKQMEKQISGLLLYKTLLDNRIQRLKVKYQTHIEIREQERQNELNRNTKEFNIPYCRHQLQSILKENAKKIGSIEFQLCSKEERVKMHKHQKELKKMMAVLS